MLFKAFAIPLIALSLAAPALAAETLEVVANPQTNRKVTISAFDPIGQSFTAQTNTVSSIGFQFSVLNTGSANSPLTLSLFQGETLTGASLFTQSFVLPGSIMSRNDVEWVDIALPDVVLTLGSLYTAVLNASSSRAALVVGPAFDVRSGQLLGGDAYTGGRLLTNSANIYSNCQGPGNNCDAKFRVTGDVIAGVAEPSTWAFLVLGFGAVGAGLRRRTRKLSYVSA